MAARRGKALVILFATVVLLSIWLARPAIYDIVWAHRSAGSVHAASTVLRGSCGVWTRVPGADPTGAAEDQFYGVAAISPDDVWGVGFWSTAIFGTPSSLIEHWNGANWSVVPGPTPNSSQSTDLFSVAATSANDVWAVGDYDNTAQSAVETLTEHWNGKAWSVVPSPNPSSATQSQFVSVAADAPDDVWAVGYFVDSTTHHTLTLAEHYDGTLWSIVPTPNVMGSSGPMNNQFEGVSVRSSGDVWAVGGAGIYGSSPEATLTEHWNGKSWSIVTSANSSLTNNYLSGVAAVSAGNVWAVGSSADTYYNTLEPLAEHFDGRSWSIVAMPSPYPTNTVPSAVTSVPHSSQVWTAGEMFTGSERVTYMSRWNGSVWVAVPSARGPSTENYVYGVSADAANDVWVVGMYNPNLPPPASRVSPELRIPLRQRNPNGGAPGSAILIIHYHILPTGQPCPPSNHSLVGGCACG